MSLHYLRQEKALVALEKRLAKFSHQEKAILIYILGLGGEIKEAHLSLSNGKHLIRTDLNNKDEMELWIQGFNLRELVIIQDDLTE